MGYIVVSLEKAEARCIILVCTITLTITDTGLCLYDTICVDESEHHVRVTFHDTWPMWSMHSWTPYWAKLSRSHKQLVGKAA